MIRYLINNDYNIIIQDVQLQQLIQNDYKKLYQAENIAKSEIKYYLSQRWDLNSEFSNTGIYDYNATYSASNRVVIDFNSFTSSFTYSLGDCIINNGYGYCLTGTSSQFGTFSSQYWSNIGSQYVLYYTQYPEPLFNYEFYYNINDKVFWKDKIWNCNIATIVRTISENNQYLSINNIPFNNVFPDDKILNKNQVYWSDLGTYSIPSNTLPTDLQYWTQGDNRDQTLLQWFMDITLYILHKSISPKNIPDLRLIAYKKACEGLKMVGDGDYNLEALVKQPKSGTMIRFGGDTPNPSNW